MGGYRIDRALDAVLLIAKRLNDTGKKQEDIWMVLQAWAERFDLSAKELESLLAAVAALRGVPSEEIDRRAPAVIERYLQTEEGRKLNELVTELV